MKNELGLVHIYFGPGKGKTSAALGLGLRAYGRGFRVLVVQFLKGASSGELEAIAVLGPRYRLHRGPHITKFTWQMDEAEKAAARTLQGGILDYARGELALGSCDVLVLDEALGALEAGLIELGQLLALLRERPRGVELVLTGRQAPAELLAVADYASEIAALKHPWPGMAARIGIES